MELIINYRNVASDAFSDGTPRSKPFTEGVVSLTLRAISSDQAPVAFASYEKKLPTQAEFLPVFYRWYDGVLWVDCRSEESSRLLTDNYTDFHAVLGLATDAPKLKECPVEALGRVFQGALSVDDYFQACAKQWLYIDGILHRAASEPMYMVRSCRQGKGYTLISVANRVNQLYKSSAYFSLLELAEAQSCAATLSKLRGGVEVVMDCGFRFEVLMPEAIQWKNSVARLDDTGNAA